MYEFYYPDEKPITVIDGELNPSYFRPLEFEFPDSIEEQKERQRKQAEQDKRAKEEFKKLYPKVKDLVLRLKNGKIIVLDLKDPKYGWLIRWRVRDLLRHVVLKGDV